MVFVLSCVVDKDFLVISGLMGVGMCGKSYIGDLREVVDWER